MPGGRRGGSDQTHCRRLTLNNIPILNVYYLLCYAWGRVQGPGHRAAGHARGSLDSSGPAGQGGRRRRQPPLPPRHRPRIRGKAGGPRRHPREAGGQRDGEASAAGAGPGRVRLRRTVGGHPAKPHPAHIAAWAAGAAPTCCARLFKHPTSRDQAAPVSNPRVGTLGVLAMNNTGLHKKPCRSVRRGSRGTRGKPSS